MPVIPGVTCDSPHKEKEKSKLINGQKNVTAQHKPVELPTVEVEKGGYKFLHEIRSYWNLYLQFYCILVEDKKQEEPQFEMDIWICIQAQIQIICRLQYFYELGRYTSS